MQSWWGGGSLNTTISLGAAYSKPFSVFDKSFFLSVRGDICGEYSSQSPGSFLLGMSISVFNCIRNYIGFQFDAGCMMPKLAKQLGTLGSMESNMLIKLSIVFPHKPIKNIVKTHSVKYVGSQLSRKMV